MDLTRNLLWTKWCPRTMSTWSTPSITTSVTVWFWLSHPGDWDNRFPLTPNRGSIFLPRISFVSLKFKPNTNEQTQNHGPGRRVPPPARHHSHEGLRLVPSGSDPYLHGGNQCFFPPQTQRDQTDSWVGSPFLGSTLILEEPQFFPGFHFYFSKFWIIFTPLTN